MPGVSGQWIGRSDQAEAIGRVVAVVRVDGGSTQGILRFIVVDLMAITMVIVVAVVVITTLVFTLMKP